MKKLTAEELKTMTMTQIREWVDTIACAINRTSVMCWDHTSLFKGYNVKPEYLGYDGGRFIIEGFRFTSNARKADYIGFAEWLHWAIFGEYPTEETEEITEAETTETTEEQTTEETTTTEESASSAPSANHAKPTTEESFEIRQLDCWMYDGEWTQNTSYNMGEMQTKAQNISKAFTAWMKRHFGISFKNNKTLIEYDGDCYTIIDRKTKEPMFIAIPQC